MESKLIVTCQYYENYNVGPDGFNTYGDGLPHWKPKGGHTFAMPVDSDTVFYSNDEVLVKAIKNLVESQNSIASKFEYVEHELVTSEPTLVKGLDTEVEKVEKWLGDKMSEFQMGSPSLEQEHEYVNYLLESLDK